MTLDRKDYKSAIPQLESRLQQLEKVGRELTNKFDDIAHQTQLQAAEAEKKEAALDYQIGSVTVVTEYQLCADGFDPVETGWSTTMPSITYQSYNGKTLWARSVTYQNDVAIRKTAPQKVELMDGLYTFVNSASGNTGWTMIDGDFIQTGKIASTNGYSYFDIDNNSFQMKDASTVALSNSVLAWQNGLLYVKGKIAVGSSSTDQKYYTEMASGGFDIVANNVTLAHIGYGNALDSSGSLASNKPFYTFGKRSSDSVGELSVAEGDTTTASAYASHAEGINTKTYNGTYLGSGAHAEGIRSEAGAQGAHAEGYHTQALAYYSHAGGNESVVSANASYGFAHGDHVTSDRANLFVIGKYNNTTNSANKLFVIGNGYDSSPSNAFEVDIYGNIKAGGLDCGKVSITPVADQVTSKTVTFSHTFSSAPNVVATAESAYPNAVSEVTVSNITTTGFTMNLLRTTNVATNIFWIAML